jgi:hypothetical protein
MTRPRPSRGSSHSGGPAWNGPGRRWPSSPASTAP